MINSFVPSLRFTSLRFYSTRPGLLEYIDLAEQRGGLSDSKFYTILIKKAKTIQHIKDLLDDAERRFGRLHPLLLSSAAYTASSSEVRDRDAKLSVSLLQRISKKDWHLVHAGVPARVLGTASAQGLFDDAKIAYDMIPTRSRTPTDLARLIAAGLDPGESKRRILELIRSNGSLDNMDIRAVGVFLKVASLSNDLKLGQLIWSWSEQARNLTKQLTQPVIIQYLQLLCDNEQWNEAKTLVRKLIHQPAPSNMDIRDVGFFLKVASLSNDLKLGQLIWSWSEQVRNVTKQFTQPVIIQYLQLLCDNEEWNEAKTLVRKLIHQPAPPAEMDIRNVGFFLKVALLCNDLELGQMVWSWSEEGRKITTQELTFIYIQYLLLCGKAGKKELCKNVWDEAVISGVSNHPKVMGAMLTVLSFFKSNPETEEFLSRLQPENMTPPILISILTSYSHFGCPQSAWVFLKQVRLLNKPIVTLDAYNTVVDAFARKAEFNESMKIINEAKQDGFEPNVVTWMSVLSPCRHYRELEVALHAFNQIKLLQQVDTDSHLVSAYVLMADVYKACGDSASADALHQERLGRGLMKIRGEVKVTVHNNTYTFSVGKIPKQLSRYTEAIYTKLQQWEMFISSQGGSTDSIQCRHSEKLALAFAVIKGLKDISLLKNLRICDSCHQASILVTVYEGITIRHWDNSKRVHIMKDGVCSCSGHY